MQAQQKSSYLFDGNAPYLEELYENYLADPQSVSAEWRHYFANMPGNGSDASHAEIRAYFLALAKNPTLNRAPISGDAAHERLQAQVEKLIDAYRRYGHYRAKVDPLAQAKVREIPELDLACRV